MKGGKQQSKVTTGDNSSKRTALTEQKCAYKYLIMLYSVFVTHLPADTTREELKDLFNECGEVKGVFIKASELPFTYGFVRFPNPLCVLKAVQEVSEWTLHGSVLKLEIARQTKELLQYQLPAKHLSWKDMKRDNSVRARVKEACHAINKELDIIHGDVILSSEWVIDQMVCTSPWKSTRLAGTVSSSALMSQSKLLSRFAEEILPASEPPANQRQLEDVLKNLRSEIEACYANIMHVEENKLCYKDRDTFQHNSQVEGDAAHLSGFPECFRNFSETADSGDFGDMLPEAGHESYDEVRVINGCASDLNDARFTNYNGHLYGNRMGRFHKICNEWYESEKGQFEVKCSEAFLRRNSAQSVEHSDVKNGDLHCQNKSPQKQSISVKPRISSSVKPRITSPVQPRFTSPVMPRIPSPVKPRFPSVKPRIPSPSKPRITSPVKPRFPSVKPRIPSPSKPRITSPVKPRILYPVKAKIPSRCQSPAQFKDSRHSGLRNKERTPQKQLESQIDPFFKDHTGHCEQNRANSPQKLGTSNISTAYSDQNQFQPQFKDVHDYLKSKGSFPQKKNNKQQICHSFHPVEENKHSLNCSEDLCTEEESDCQFPRHCCKPIGKVLTGTPADGSEDFDDPLNNFHSVIAKAICIGVQDMVQKQMLPLDYFTKLPALYAPSAEVPDCVNNIAAEKEYPASTRRLREPDASLNPSDIENAQQLVYETLDDLAFSTANVRRLSDQLDRQKQSRPESCSSVHSGQVLPGKNRILDNLQQDRTRDSNRSQHQSVTDFLQIRNLNHPSNAVSGNVCLPVQSSSYASDVMTAQLPKEFEILRLIHSESLSHEQEINEREEREAVDFNCAPVKNDQDALNLKMRTSSQLMMQGADFQSKSEMNILEQKANDSQQDLRSSQDKSFLHSQQNKNCEVQVHVESHTKHHQASSMEMDAESEQSTSFSAASKPIDQSECSISSDVQQNKDSPTQVSPLPLSSPLNIVVGRGRGLLLSSERKGLISHRVEGAEEHLITKNILVTQLGRGRGKIF